MQFLLVVCFFLKKISFIFVVVCLFTVYIQNYSPIVHYVYAQLQALWQINTFCLCAWAHEIIPCIRRRRRRHCNSSARCKMHACLGRKLYISHIIRRHLLCGLS